MHSYKCNLFCATLSIPDLEQAEVRNITTHSACFEVRKVRFSSYYLTPVTHTPIRVTAPIISGPTCTKWYLTQCQLTWEPGSLTKTLKTTTCIVSQFSSNISGNPERFWIKYWMTLSTRVPCCYICLLQCMSYLYSLHTVFKPQEHKNKLKMHASLKTVSTILNSVFLK